MYYRERSCLFFPKMWSDTLDGKWKMIFLKKIHGNMTFSSNFLKRWCFQKRTHRDMVFLVLSGKMVFFSQKHDTFSLGRKLDMIFLKKYMEIWYFRCTSTGVTNVVSRPSAKKSERWSYPAKIHLNLIDVLGWHPRKNSSNSLYFHGHPLQAFLCIALQCKRKQET